MTVPDATPEGPYRVRAVDRYGQYPWGWRVPGDPAVANARHVYRTQAEAQARADELNRRERLRKEALP